MTEAGDVVDVPVVFVGHAELPEGVRSAVEMILGPQENLWTVQLGPAADPADTARQIGHALDQMHANAQVGALVLTDLQGGSPSNAAAAVFLERRYVRVVAGLSLPMALEVLADRQGRAAGELADVAVVAGQRSVTDVSRSLAAVAPHDRSGGGAIVSPVGDDA